MIKYNKQIIYFIVFLTFSSFLCVKEAQACDSKDSTWIAEKDSSGRLVLLWVENSGADKVLKVSLDGGPSTTLSSPGQKIFSPRMAITPANDIVISWLALDIDENSIYCLYVAMLPFEGTWSTPSCVSEVGELIVSNSNKILAHSSTDINVFWESVTYLPSLSNSDVLCKQKDLRKVTGTINLLGTPSSAIVLQQKGS